jgi:hypothetical protein
MVHTDTIPRKHAVSGRATASIDYIDMVRRCSAWEDAAPHAELVCPARLLTSAAVAKWVREHRASVAVGTEQELALAIAAGIHPGRVVFHCDSAVTRTVWHAVGLSVGRFVVNAEGQILTVSACAPHRQRVLVDVTDEPACDLLAAVCAEERLELIGLHCRLDRANETDDVTRVIGQMAEFCRGSGDVLTRLSLAVPDLPGPSVPARRMVVAAIDDVLESTCRRLRVPRPAVMVAPQLRPTVP